MRFSVAQCRALFALLFVGLLFNGGAASSRADLAGFAGFAPANSSGHAASTGLSADGMVLTLSDGADGEAASAFARAPQAVGGFHAEFTYQADKFGGPPPGGADGVRSSSRTIRAARKHWAIRETV